MCDLKTVGKGVIIVKDACVQANRRCGLTACGTAGGVGGERRG